MALKLYLLRHAKAEPHSLQKDDIDRALAERGMQDARRLGKHLAAQQMLDIDYVWCSSAVRTRQTFECLKEGIIQAGGTFAAPVDYEAKLYHAPAQRMLNILHMTPLKAKTTLILGHNPGISELAGILARRGSAALMEEVRNGYPTCALSVYEFDCITWQEIDSTRSAIKHFFVPEK